MSEGKYGEEPASGVGAAGTLDLSEASRKLREDDRNPALREVSVRARAREAGRRM